MEVYIKGMKMPESCAKCPAFRNTLRCGITGFPFYSNERNERRMHDCPLVPVPSHGRLVDADKLIWRLTPDEAFYPTEVDRFDYDSSRLMVRDIRSFIRDQPTIIPASEEAAT